MVDFEKLATAQPIDPGDDGHVWHEVTEVVPTGKFAEDGTEICTIQKTMERCPIYDVPPQGNVPLIDGLIWIYRDNPDMVRKLKARKARMDLT